MLRKKGFVLFQTLPQTIGELLLEPCIE